MPTCFIVYKGMITGSIASARMTDPLINKIAHFMLLFGFGFYTILLPVVLYIVFKSEILDDKKLPTVGIIGSPSPLGIVGILTIEEESSIYAYMAYSYWSYFTCGCVQLYNQAF